MGGKSPKRGSMLARKNKPTAGKVLPTEWLEAVARILNETFKRQCKDQGRYFDIYGQLFSDEMLVIASFLHEKDQEKLPITCFLSCDKDQIGTPKMVRDTQGDFLDLFGLFFDEIFAEDDWNQYEPLWQEVQYKTTTYFYKITRENIVLTLEANQLLGDFNED